MKKFKSVGSVLVLCVSLLGSFSAAADSSAKAIHFVCPGSELDGPARKYVYDQEVGAYGALRTDTAKRENSRVLAGPNPFLIEPLRVSLSFDMYGANEKTVPGGTTSVAVITLINGQVEGLDLVGFVGPGSGRSVVSCEPVSESAFQ